MKRAIGFGVALLALALVPAAMAADETKNSGSGGNEPQWLTSYADAMAQAKASGKIIMADFTGSDWCGFCIKLKKQVFSTAEFKQWAGQSLVLLEVDFPHKTKLPDDLAQQNKDLQTKFKVHGFPTCIFMSADGTELGRVSGFSGVDAWWAKVKAVVDKINKK